MENVEIKSVEARRSFLKKVAYVAPAVVVLGSLTLPSSAQASTFTDTIYSKTTGAELATVSVYGNSGTGVLDAPTAGAKVRTVNGDTTTYTTNQVIANDDDYFTFAKKWFSNIIG